MEAVGVDITVDGDRLNAELAAGADHTTRDLASVRDENLVRELQGEARLRSEMECTSDTRTPQQLNQQILEPPIHEAHDSNTKPLAESFKPCYAQKATRVC